MSWIINDTFIRVIKIGSRELLMTYSTSLFVQSQKAENEIRNHEFKLLNQIRDLVEKQEA